MTSVLLVPIAGLWVALVGSFGVVDGANPPTAAQMAGLGTLAMIVPSASILLGLAAMRRSGASKLLGIIGILGGTTWSVLILWSCFNAG